MTISKKYANILFNILYLKIAMVNKSRLKKSVNILFTCVGRRVSLLQGFRKAARQLKIAAKDFKIFGTEINELNPALQNCDKKFIVKPTNSPDYIKQLISIVKRNAADMIIPTTDLDLKTLALYKQNFAKLGCRVLISEPAIIDICQDKRKTHKFLTKHGFNTPTIYSIKTKPRNTFPCFLKPWDGSASKSNTIVRNEQELAFYSKRIRNCIVQEFIDGTEYTCDVYIDFSLKARCVVPRKRIQVRAGEVSKSQVIKNKEIMHQASMVAETLKAGPGVITIQLFLTEDNQIIFIEINPRFGGGVPLSIKAGANFPKWILQEFLHSKDPNVTVDNINFNDFKDQLIMLRYDSEVWL